MLVAMAPKVIAAWKVVIANKICLLLLLAL